MTKEQFSSAVKLALETYSEAELARHLKVSVPTIGRWAKGESAPHPLGREVILAALTPSKSVLE